MKHAAAFTIKDVQYEVQTRGNNYADLVDNLLVTELTDEGNVATLYVYHELPDALMDKVEDTIDGFLKEIDEAARDYAINQRIAEARGK